MKEQSTPLGTIKLTDFALRHFDPEFGGTKILNTEPKQFEQYLNIFANQYFEKPDERWIDKEQDIIRVNILDGYADFCKLLVMKNITDARAGSLPIDYKNLANRNYLRTGYSARREGELPVPTEWLDLPVSTPRAEYTVTILYSKEQIDKEVQAMYNKKLMSDDIDSIGLEPPVSFDADWGAVAILGQMYHKEEPMKPMTMLRNYMPIEFGGSGMKFPEMPVKPNVPEVSELMVEYKKAVIEYKEKMEKIHADYNRSVEFWKNNATVK
jgi:hypothetical protein